LKQTELLFIPGVDLFVIYKTMPYKHIMVISR
jgi:hypothetical protein